MTGATYWRGRPCSFVTLSVANGSCPFLLNVSVRNFMHEGVISMLWELSMQFCIIIIVISECSTYNAMLKQSVVITTEHAYKGTDLGIFLSLLIIVFCQPIKYSPPFFSAS